MNLTINSQVLAAELRLLNRKLEALSATDGLTGIANRRHFDATLATEWTRAARRGHSLALCFLDVDSFKKYNDHYGHQAGDDCLRRVGLYLNEPPSQPRVFVARLGDHAGDPVAVAGHVADREIELGHRDA